MTPDQQTDGLINNPEITPEGKPTVRAVKDVGQAQRLVKAIIAANRDRNIINGRIAAKYNAEKPYRQSELEAEGLSWRSNFTTKPLPTIVDKVAPRFVEAINALKYLTNSSLPSNVPGASAKTEKIRRKVTEAVRGRKGWNDFLDDVAQENAMYGYTGVACLDEFTWFPTSFRQDEFFVPKGTKQQADSAQVVLLKETYLPHELFEIIDREGAAEVGWNVKEAISQINKALPEDFRSKTQEYDRMYEDLRRELNVSLSYEANRVIVVWSLLVREVEGKISHYRLAGPELESIFEKQDRFDQMSDCVSFFSFQKGNRTMHGSKGIGRDIYELAGIIDRSRNETVDRLMLSGKVFIQTDDKNVKRFRMSVVGNAILIGRGFTVLEQRIDGNVQPFLQLDSYLGLIVDQLIGSVSPRQLQGERVTAAQVNLLAQREEEGKDSKITRFLNQFVNMMGLIQKRILDPDTEDEVAKKLQEELLEDGITREELDMFRKSPVAGTISDLTPMQRQQVVLIAQENRGNPLYNQRKLEEEKLTAQVSADFAKTILLPDEDPTVEAEQIRLQQMELSLLMAGQGVPVSPRDNHKVHMSLVIPTFEPLAQGIHAGQASTDDLQRVFDHASQHFTYALQQGATPDSLAAEKASLDNIRKILIKLREVDQKAETLKAASGALLQQTAGEDAQAAQSLAISSQIEQRPT